MAVARRRRVTVGVEFEGPWFEHDPLKTMDQNIEQLMKEMAEFGQRDVQARIAAIPPRGVRTGRTRRAYVGRVKSLTGKPWHQTAVVSPSIAGLNRRQAISRMAAAAWIESQWHPIRQARADQRKFGKRLHEELLKGLV